MSYQNLQVNEKGETETVLPKTIEQAGLDKEPKVVKRTLPIDEFRYIKNLFILVDQDLKISQYEINNFVKWLIFRFVMSSLNISGRRIIDMETVEEMIKAVDDGDGQLEYDEFIQLLKK